VFLVFLGLLYTPPERYPPAGPTNRDYPTGCATDVAKGVAMIAEHMGLPIVVRLKVLPKGYRADAKHGFRSQALVRSDGGESNAGITAQVTIPRGLPLYGSSAMRGYPMRCPDQRGGHGRSGCVRNGHGSRIRTYRAIRHAAPQERG